MTNEEVLEKLKNGNTLYLKATVNSGNVSERVRLKTVTDGQHPYAIVICCSDSRVLPESIFSAGIGELFVLNVRHGVEEIKEAFREHPEMQSDELAVIGAVYHTDTGVVDWLQKDRKLVRDV